MPDSSARVARGDQALVDAVAAAGSPRRPAPRRPRPWRSARRAGMKTSQGTPRARAAKRHRLRVVARAAGHDPPRAAVVAQRGELVQRAADLERAGALQVLGLEHDLAAAALGQRARGQDRRVPGDVADRGAVRARSSAGARPVHQPCSATIASISTSAPLGSAATAIATRAGGSSSKNVAVDLVDRRRRRPCRSARRSPGRRRPAAPRRPRRPPRGSAGTARLLGRRAADELVRLGVQRDLARAEQQAAGARPRGCRDRPPPGAVAAVTARRCRLMARGYLGGDGQRARARDLAVPPPAQGQPGRLAAVGRGGARRAREDDRPLLVSIGYSACHWCHVMERECFEDPQIAALMNEHFVCVKVDREERPDVDAIYMEAVQAMTGQGGWPLNVFLTPDQVPFFGGTYFPPEPRHGMPSWPQLLLRRRRRVGAPSARRSARRASQDRAAAGGGRRRSRRPSEPMIRRRARRRRRAAARGLRPAVGRLGRARRSSRRRR